MPYFNEIPQAANAVPRTDNKLRKMSRAARRSKPIDDDSRNDALPDRSPLIFWLLLVATICVDAVAFAWAEAAGESGLLAFEPLMLSQISVVCIWSGLRSEKSLWTRVSPLLAVVVASLVWGMFSEMHFIGKVGEGRSRRIGVELVNQGIPAALLLAMLWLFKRTAFWKRRSGSSAEWQLSIADLLVVTTVVAVLGAVMRRIEFLDLDWTDILIIGSPAVLAISAVFTWSLWRTPWVLRASGVIGMAMGLAAVVSLAQRRPSVFSIVWVTHYLIQALVLMVWLAWGPLLPRASSDNRALSNSRTERQL